MSVKIKVAFRYFWKWSEKETHLMSLGLIDVVGSKARKNCFQGIIIESYAKVCFPHRFGVVSGTVVMEDLACQILKKLSVT